MSRNTRSGDCSAIAVFASAPLPHSPTISMSSSSRSSDTIRARAIGSSSATIVLIFTSGSPGLNNLGRRALIDGERHRDGDAEPALDVGKDEAVALSIEVLEARSCVGQADAVVEERESIAGYANSGIAHSDGQAIAHVSGADLDHTGCGARCDAMSYRVLHERLQQQHRNPRIEASGSTWVCTVNRVPNRVFSMSTYFCSSSNSSRSVTSWVPDECSVARSSSASRSIIRSAALTSVRMRPEIVLSVLKRKCGCS